MIKNVKMPSPDQLQRDFSNFLREKYGNDVVIPPDPSKEKSEPFDNGPDRDIKSKIDFNLRPSQLEAFLKEYVVDQEEAIEVLSTKICTHFNRMKLETKDDGVGELVGNIKSNVLMLGPTGVGKTYLIKLIAKRIGVPFAKGDATKFSETGYVGGDVEDLVRDLVHEANGDIKLAEYGIIYIDEIDKIASAGNVIGLDVSRTGVQRCLIKLMEEAEVDIKTPHDLAAQMEAAMEVQKTGKVKRKKINTKNILFVMSGAFNGLADIVKKRLNQQPIGFRTTEGVNSDVDNNLEMLKSVRSEDLINYGFESEFVGRLPVVITLNELNVKSLYHILKNPNSTVILGKKRDFLAYDIILDFEDEALKKIAELAFEEHTGARGLLSVTDRILLKYEKTLPDTSISNLTITRQIIDNPVSEMEKLLSHYYIERFKEQFYKDSGISLEFSEKAVNLIFEEAKIKGKTPEDICNEKLRDYIYGLRLLKCTSFTIDEETVLHPKSQIDNLIKHAYE